MSHTDAFNQIMNSVNKKVKDKAMTKKIQPVLVGARDNMNELQTSLSKCLYAANTVYLPTEQLPNYSDLRKALISAGASYQRNTFVFPNDAKPYLDRLMGGESVNIKKEFQFFATPAGLAAQMVEMADVNNYQRILEPSAGQGSIIKAIHAACSVQVDYCELMDVNRSVLADLSGCNLIAEDFMELGKHGYYDRIIANPPFTKNQDIDHIRHMVKHLKEGGRIVTIASNSWRTGSQKKQIEFRQWLDDLGAVVEDIEAGTFSESGTKIATCLITIDK